MIHDLCVKFLLSSLIRSVSGTPFPWSPYLEDVDGAWPNRYLEDGVILDIMDRLDMCAKFQLFSLIGHVSRTQHPLSTYLEDVDGSWLSSWRMGSSLTPRIIIIYDSWLVCQISAPNDDWKCVKNPPSLKCILQGCWRFLTGVLENGVILDIMDHHDVWFLTCVPNFSSLPWLELCQEPPVLEVHTWRTLKVPDWSLGGWGHL